MSMRGSAELHRVERYMACTRRLGEHVYPHDCDPAYGE
jgi:hypothetical protein